MDASPLVSIIIPCYNTAEYVHRAIYSSLRQTHKNIEVIVVNDGSKDDTLKVLQSFAQTDSRIRVLSQENAGVSVARNHALSEAKGEYIVFLDSDDWLEDDALELLLNTQKEHPDSVICANQRYNVRVEGGKLFASGAQWDVMPSADFNMKEIAETFAFLRWPNVFRSLHAKLFRASYGTRLPEGVAYAEDAAFFIDYLARAGGKVYYLNKPIINILDRQGSAVRQKKYKSKVFDDLTAAHKVMDDAVKDEEVKKVLMMSYDLHVYYACQIASGISWSEIKRMKKAIRSSAWDVIKCKAYPLSMRIRFFLLAFAPVPIYKAITSVGLCKQG